MIQVPRILSILGWILVLTTSANAAKRKNVVPCTPFPYAFLENGRIASVGSQRYMIHCDVGFKLAGPREVKCFKGNWTTSREPKCLKSTGFCEPLPSIRGGDVLGEERRTGSVVQYMCHSGFLLLGAGTRHCLPSGHWSGVTPACMDENEPIKRAAERLKENFITDIGSYSNDSVAVAQGRSLDRASLLHGLELVILLDRSSSIDPHDFRIAVNFIKSLLQEFGVRNGEDNVAGTRAAVITFGDEANFLFNLDDDVIKGLPAAYRALDSLQPNGGATAMEEAFTLAYTNEAPLRPKSKRALFLLTDGEPNKGSVENTLSFAKQIKRDFDYEVFTVGIGRGVNRTFLSQMASEPLINHVFVFNKYSNLREIMDAIKDESTNRPVSPAQCGYIKSEQHYLKVWRWLATIYVGLPDKTNSPRLSFCSGTLICSQWVITAASCFYNIYENNATEKVAESVTKEVFVVLGERHLKHEDRNQMNFYAEDVFIHPEFQPLKDLQNNLALIKLNSPAPMERFRTACLPSTTRPVLLHLDLNTNASTAGWGLPPSLGGQRDITGGTVQFYRSNTTLTLEVESACRRVSGESFNDNLFCASGPDGARTCTGDMGSPIIAVDPDTNLHHVIGVLSRKSNCEDQRINQYSDLTKYIPWIDDVTQKCRLQHLL